MISLTKATALRVKPPRLDRRNSRTYPPLGGSDRVSVKQHPHLPPEQIEKHGYPLDILHSLEQTHAIGKGAVKKTDLVARLKGRRAPEGE